MNQSPSRRLQFWSDTGLFYAALIWGTTFVIVKSALTGVDAVTMVGYRFLIAGGLLLGYLLIKRKPILPNFREGFFLAIILWTLYVTQTVGLNYTTASNSGFITGLFVLWVPVFLVTLFRRRPTVMEIIASVISLVGLWILTGGLKEVNIGDLLTIVASMAYALHLLLSDKYIKAGVDPIAISCQQFLLVGLGSIAMTAITGRSFDVTTNAAWGAIIFLALFPTLSAFVIQMFAQRHTSPLRVSLIFALEPVFAAAAAWTVGGEQFTMHSGIGGACIVIGLALSGIQLPNKSKSGSVS
ncbi:MAG: EamA family transporter [bacterium]|nr:EamA family transporter [bacterium]